ncbi:MAG TPA: S8 family serine peptidase [Dehalococcoidia bacterium]|nr:S8 family serine peptidase [Dehalococcoidia bacterium]
MSAGIASVRVAVMDTGISVIPDLAGRIDAGINYASSDPNDTRDDDAYGHGTSVASIIAAATDNGIGIAGVAPAVHVVAVRVCAQYPENCQDSAILSGLDWILNDVLDRGSISVINMSFSGSQIPGASWYFKTLDSLGVISVASSGNAGGSVEYPAADANVIAVGGVLPNGQRAGFSNYGSDLDLAAPAQTYAMNNIDAPWYFEGTSASAPFISGLAALFKSTQPLDYSISGRSSGIPSGPNTRTDFINAAKFNADGTTRGWSQDIGYGVPDAWATIYAGACARFDLNGDGEIDVSDDQTQAAHLFLYRGWDPRYDERYDLYPSLVPDGAIDIRDLQKVFGRNPFTCPR